MTREVGARDCTLTARGPQGLACKVQDTKDADEASGVPHLQAGNVSTQAKTRSQSPSPPHSSTKSSTEAAGVVKQLGSVVLAMPSGAGHFATRLLVATVRQLPGRFSAGQCLKSAGVEPWN